jgi:uncharacterized RDD family membrane protein YckC
MKYTYTSKRIFHCWRLTLFLRRICDALEISWCFGFVAFLLVKSSPYNQRLGDMIAKTRVVGKEEPGPEVVFDFEKI